MVREKYGVQLSTQEKGWLRQMIRAGRSSAQAITRARILLRTDQGWTASQVYNWGVLEELLSAQRRIASPICLWSDELLRGEQGSPRTPSPWR